MNVLLNFCKENKKRKAKLCIILSRKYKKIVNMVLERLLNQVKSENK